VSQQRLEPSEVRALQEALNSESKNVNIRLREGEYQYSLAKAIASFELELVFPDVKDLIRSLYGEGKADDIQFIRKIQTILKKMEKSGIVTILPKSKPWDLQRYALLSLKFEDVDRNLVILATDEQVTQAQLLLNSALSQIEPSETNPIVFKLEALALALIIIAGYIIGVWALSLTVIDLIVFVPAFSMAVSCSLVLGRLLSKG
jgi:hypothetical protein